MAPRISLALAIHNHQPVGNFGWVMDEVFEKAYEPMLAALERHAHVRLSLHYSPYLAARGACIRQAADGMIDLRARRAGVLELAFRVTAGHALAAISGRRSSCRD